MLTILRQRNFALFWFADLVSMVGDWLLFIALPYYVYQLTGSALATGLSFVLYNVPRLVLSSVAGVFVDRWNRQRILIIANVANAILICPLVLVQSSTNLWIIYAVVFFQASVSHVLILLGMAIATMAAGAFGVLALLSSAGLLYATAGVIAFLMLQRIRTFPQVAAACVADVCTCPMSTKGSSDDA